LYWHIGQRIRSEVLGKGERAAYGEQIVSALARQLEADYGRGFSEKNLRHMLRFAEAFPDRRNCLRSAETIELDAHQDPDLHRRPAQTRLTCKCASRKAGCAHPARPAGLPALRAHRLSATRATAGKLATLRRLDHPPAVRKTPTYCDFLGLQDRYLEKDLEDAILRELENFLLELGFTFVRGKSRIQIDTTISTSTCCSTTAA
jgi:hypothetical protein